MKNKVYVIKVGEMFFKDFGEDGTEPTFILPNLLGYEDAVKKYNNNELVLAVDTANMIDGKIVVMSEEECSRSKDARSLNIVDFIEKRCFHKQMTQDDVGNIIGNNKYSNEQKLEIIKKYLEIGEETEND